MTIEEAEKSHIWQCEAMDNESLSTVIETDSHVQITITIDLKA